MFEWIGPITTVLTTALGDGPEWCDAWWCYMFPQYCTECVPPAYWGT